MNFKKVTAGLLSVLLLAGTFTACGDKEQSPDKPQKEEQQQSETQQPRVAYKSTYAELTSDQGQPLDYVEQFTVQGNQAFYAGNYITGKETAKDFITGEEILDEEGKPIETDAFAYGLFAMDLETRTISKLAYESTPIPEGMQGGVSIRGMIPMPDGGMYLVENVDTYSFDVPENFDPETQDAYEFYAPGENYSNLIRVDAQGQVQSTVKLELPEEFYAQNYYVDSKGNLYACSYEGVYLFDAQGKQLGQIELGENGGGDIFQISPDEIGIMTFSQAGNGMVMKLIDPETKSLGKELPVADGAWQVYPGFGDYHYLYRKNDSVYGYVEETQSKEKLFSWLDCDLNVDLVEHFAFLEGGRVAAMERDWSQDETQNNLIVLDPVDPATLPQKETLTLGTFGMDTNLRNLIIRFNRTHNDVRIQTRDFMEMIDESSPDGYQNAMQKLNTEILSGKMPDILVNNSMPVDQYASKGLLLDLWPFIESDPDLGRDALMEHFFDAISIDGKLYLAPDTFTMSSAAVNEKIAAGRTSWTVDEVIEELNKLQPGAGIFGETMDKPGVLSTFLTQNLDTYIDWENGTSSFDSEAFVKMLEFANYFQEQFDYENYDWENRESEYSRLGSGKQLMYQCYVSDFQEIQVTNAYLGGKAVLIGMPSDAGNGSTFNLGPALSISAKTAHPDLAWSFVRENLLAENQIKDHGGWGFPTNKQAFDAMAKKAMTPEYYTDPETGEQVEQSKGGYGIDNDFEIEVYSTTQEEYDQIMALYESCNSVGTYNMEIMNMILEEAAPFFAGQKTAQEAAKMIQDRVGLYIMEQR